jgi:hypothetical protein
LQAQGKVDLGTAAFCPMHGVELLV